MEMRDKFFLFSATNLRCGHNLHAYVQGFPVSRKKLRTTMEEFVGSYIQCRREGVAACTVGDRQTLVPSR